MTTDPNDTTGMGDEAELEAQRGTKWNPTGSDVEAHASKVRPGDVDEAQASEEPDVEAHMPKIIKRAD